MNAVTAFLDYLRAERRASANTVDAYGRDLAMFTDFLANERHGETVEKATDFDVRAFLASREGHDSAATLNRRIATIKSFYVFAHENGLSVHNPTRRVKPPKMERRLPETPSKADVAAIIKASATDLRSRALVEFLASTGCRISEALALNVGDIDAADNAVRVFGKGQKERVVFLNKSARSALVAYLRDRRVTDRKDAPLFADRSGKRLERTAAGHAIKGASKLAGFDFSPHDMRHAFATRMLDAGANIREVQESLGHASVATTQRYTHVSLKNLKDAHRRAMGG